MKKKNDKYYRFPFFSTELSIKKRVADLVSRLTLNEKIGLLPSNQQAVERLGIGECRFGTEIARGYISRIPGEISTVFPQPIGLAATFNPELMGELGEIAGIETRIYNNINNRQSSITNCQMLMIWGPTVDLCRDPRWGRNEESYGEDPFLTGEMSAAYTKGMVGDNKKYLRVLPGLKHFCCNNHEEDRNRDSANVDQRLLREYYYGAFEPAIRQKGAFSIMTAYNELSGIPAMLNRDIDKVCKREWGMLFAVTDGSDFSQNVNAHRFNVSHAETLALALKAGNNIMTDSAETVIAAAKEAIKTGLITESDIDAAISEVLTGRFMLGEFDPPKTNHYMNIPDNLLNCEKFKEVNARAARECITLLKNDGTLPLKDDNKFKIAVIGAHGKSNFKDWYTGMSDYNTTVYSGLCDALGKSRVSYNDGCNIVAIKSELNNKYLKVREDGSVFADSDEITPACRFKSVDWGEYTVYVSAQNEKLLRLEENDTGMITDSEPIGYVNAVGNDTFEWFGRMIFRKKAQMKLKSWRNNNIAVDKNGRLCELATIGVNSSNSFTEEIIVNGEKEAERLSKASDYVILCLGNDPMVAARECIDRKSLAFPHKQQALIQAVCKNNKNTILTVISSYPYTFSENDFPAILHTAHGGPESGNAVADVLLGRYNPAGRLPQTWYKNDEDLPDIKNYDIAKTKSTYLYSEGFNILYGFGHGLSYSRFEYSDFTATDTGESVAISLKVKNVSKIAGDEVIQIYFTALNPRVKRPKKQLCEFIRRQIEPGQVIELSLNIDKSRLRFWDVTRGKFVVESGAYEFGAGASSDDIRCSSHIQIIGEKIPPRNMNKLTPAVNYDDKRGVEIRYDKNKERHYIHAPMWNGALDYYDVKLNGITGLEITAAMDVNVGSIKVYANETLVGEIEIPAFACPSDFKKHRCRFTKSLKRNGKLTLKLSQYVNLSDIKLLNN